MRSVASVVVSAVLVVAVVHCGGSSSTGVPGDGGTSEGGSSNPPGCPASAPDPDSSCSPPAGSCQYSEGCVGLVAECTDGKWGISRTNTNVVPTCPANVPKDGDACNKCSTPSTPCDYPCSGGATSPTKATCADGKWQVAVSKSVCAVCAPACEPGKICCSEPNHMPDDAGGVGTANVCVTPQNDGSCPLFP